MQKALSSFINAFKVKDIRTRLFYTFLCLILIRVGCMIPVPGVDKIAFTNWYASKSSGLGFLEMLTGGSFSEQSIFSLNISPYITASIIIQLLAVAIPKLEELQKDGETGRKKLSEITRYSTIGLAIFQSVCMGIGYKNGNLLADGNAVLNIITITVSFTAGSAFLMWLGEQITEKGIGNGISVILLVNIVEGLPESYASLINQFVVGQSSVFYSVIGAVAIALITIVLVVLIILLEKAQRKITVQYAQKVQGRKLVGGASTYIPLKVNTAGVIPVIFAGSLMSTPQIISTLAGYPAATLDDATANWWQKTLMFLNQQQWCRFTTDGARIYSLGLILYFLLLVFFAYFYTAITFNPVEVSNNLKKQGGFIPGIRPGRPTTDYLQSVLNYVILFGVIGLGIIAFIPMLFGGLFTARVGFGGTSIIIVVGVVIEILTQIESMMRERHYKGFLSED